MLPIPVLSIHDLSTDRSGYGPLMKVSARSAGGQVCILHLARFNAFPGTKIVAIEPVQKTKPREKMVYFSLTAKLEWLTLVRPAATARAHSRSRNAFGEKTLTSCLTRVGGPEISRGRLHHIPSSNDGTLPRCPVRETAVPDSRQTKYRIRPGLPTRQAPPIRIAVFPAPAFLHPEILNTALFSNR